jgi:hypothetical protein
MTINKEINSNKVPNILKYKRILTAKTEVRSLHVLLSNSMKQSSLSYPSRSSSKNIYFFET